MCLIFKPGPIIQFHEDAALVSSVSSLFDKKFHRTMYRFILLRLLRARLGELRKPSNSYKIDVRIFKAQLLVGECRCLDFFGLSIHRL